MGPISDHGVQLCRVWIQDSDGVRACDVRLGREATGAFVAFRRHANLAAALREKRWADFARGYNGPGYAANKYDQKLQAAYEKLSPAK